MKIILTESQITNLLNELEVDKHFIDRRSSRVLDNQPYNIILNNPKTRQQEIIGEFTLPQNDFLKIQNDYEYLFNLEEKSKSKLNYGIKIHKFDLVKNWDNIIFRQYYENNMDIDQLYEDLKNGKINLWVQDKETLSTGTILVAVIKSNKLITTMIMKRDDDDFIFRKLYDRNYEDFIILDNAKDIDQYIGYSAL